jgi:hypothetical protein
VKILNFSIKKKFLLTNSANFLDKSVSLEKFKSICFQVQKKSSRLFEPKKTVMNPIRINKLSMISYLIVFFSYNYHCAIWLNASPGSIFWILWPLWQGPIKKFMSEGNQLDSYS